MKEDFFLLQKLSENDMSAREVLYIRYAPQVKSFVSAILKDSADADDVVQDIFLRIWEERQIVCQARSFKSYLFTMTRNIIYNRLKRDKVHNRYVGFESKRNPQDEIEERIMTKDLLDQIKEEMDSLTEQQRVIYELNRNDEMTYKEIAEKLGISPKTVQYHISNVLAKLKKLL